MRIISILAFAAIVAGCAKSESPPVADTGMAMQPADAPPAAMSLTDVTGRWNIRVMGETSDSTLTTYVLDATADTSTWTFTFPNGKPIPMRIVNVGGDSIVTNAGPFASQLRRGVQVRTHIVWRMQDGKLNGRTTARYATSGADSVAQLRSEGTRAQ
ncbi:MAG: hypothetical protein H0T48_13875 [Gemmatimonadaceae bacterium]|nr:hypothetical protein [Gemmatimonadaceae bacterium]